MPRPSNVSHVQLADGRIVLFSYRLPVAVYVPGNGVLAHKHHYSVTTSRHVHQFYAERVQALGRGCTLSHLADAEFQQAIAPITMERH